VEALATIVGLLSLAALVAIVVLAVTVEKWRRESRQRFAHDVGERYRSLLAELPIAELLRDEPEGTGAPDASATEHLNTLYRYFHLCEEQAMLRSGNAVDKQTWQQWHAQMRRQLGRPLFREAWSTARTRDPDAFPYLARLLAGDFTEDDPRRPVPDLPAQQAARPPAS
jgi:hypothetical protein